MHQNGFPRGKSGSKYALIFQDYLSNWPEAYPVRKKLQLDVYMVTQCVSKNYSYRTPVRCVSTIDTSKPMGSKLMGLEQPPTSGGHPQTDGLVKYFNQTHQVSKGGRGWDKLLGPVLFAYHTTLLSSTGKTSFVLVCGRRLGYCAQKHHPKTSLAFLYTVWQLWLGIVKPQRSMYTHFNSINFNISTVHYLFVATKLCENLNSIRELAGKTIRKAQTRQNYNMIRERGSQI